MSQWKHSDYAQPSAQNSTANVRSQLRAHCRWLVHWSQTAYWEGSHQPGPRDRITRAGALF